MSSTPTYRQINSAILDRIRGGEWEAGDLIPREAALSLEFGCARATMNRALRELADDGVVERRRRAGTRVAETPARAARA